MPALRRARKQRTKAMLRSAVGIGAMCVFCSVAGAGERGLVAHWPLDEGSGDTAKDISGHGNDGRIYGAKWVQYGLGAVLQFDGLDDRVNCGSPKELDLRGPMTLSAWVWPHDVPAREVGIAGKQFASYLLAYYTSGFGYWYVGAGPNNASASLPIGRWSHVLNTFDGELLTMYVGGQPVSRHRSQFDKVPGGKNFFIGCLIDDPTGDDPNDQRDGFFQGRIADVKVYSRALTDKQVMGEYTAGAKGRFAPVPAECVPIAKGVTVGHTDLTVKIGQGGGMEISAGRGFCIVESTYSYPAGGKIGFNALAEKGEHPADGAWQPRATKTGSNGARIEASGKHYALRRTVSMHEGRVDIEDELTSWANEPVGVLISNRVITQRVLTKTAEGTGGADPFVFGAHGDYDLGIVAQDLISRARFSPSITGNQAGYGVSHFALDVGKTHTFKWSIYILKPGGDVYALINRVRADWGVNRTILGPCSFFAVTDKRLDDSAALKAYLDRRHLGVAMAGTWLDYDPGELDHVPTRDEYKALMQKAIKAFKAADPNIKVLGSIETDWVTIYPEKMKGGDKLPIHGGGPSGAAWLNEEQTAVIRNADLPWKDSTVTNKAGRMCVEQYTRGGKPQIALNVLPGPGNYQSKFLMDQVRFLVDEVGLDGFYIDEFVPYWDNRCHSYHTWDGWTVDIDPSTGEITDKYTQPDVYGWETRVQLCEYAKKRGLAMVANTYATSIVEARLPTMRFAETVWGFHTDDIPPSGKPDFVRFIARARWGTPIGLGLQAHDHEGRQAQLLMRGLIAYLRHSVLYYYYVFPDLPESGPGSGEYGPVNHMFPITPVRLFEGGIVGRDRTITCVSGNYECSGAQKPKVLTFDTVGREKKSDDRLRQSGGRWTVELRLDDWNEIGVIEE